MNFDNFSFVQVVLGFWGELQKYLCFRVAELRWFGFTVLLR